MRQSKDKLKVQPNLILNIKDNINDIFMYKKAYQIHVRKLSEIRNMRKNNLNNTIQRNYHIQHIKDTMHNNFMYKLNQQAIKIDQDNLKLFDKLNKEMTTSRSANIKQPVSMKPRKSFDLSSAYLKNQKERQLSKQNKRLIDRIKSSESCISHSKFSCDEKKRQDIKSRIRKFNDNSQLKSQRYFSVMSARQQRNASLSCNLEHSKNPNDSIDDNPKKHTSFTARKLNTPKVTSFYNPRDIFKNKIENYGIIKFKSNKNKLIKNYEKTRPVTIETDRKKQRASVKNRPFFPTEAL